MNKQVKEKLRMQKPEYYDATENKAVVVQEHALINLFRDGRQEGRSISSIITCGSFCIATILSLASAQFTDKFYLSAEAWRAVFIMVAVISGLFAFRGCVIILTRWKRKKLFSEDVVISKFFANEKKIK